MSSIWYESAGRSWMSCVLPPDRTLRGEQLGLPQLAFHALDRSALLLVQPGQWVRVNGLPILGGLRVLGHKDEILVVQGRLFFSQESTPTVVKFRALLGGRIPTCPICRGPIREQSEAVQCPGCGRWFHQSSTAGENTGKPCWTYAPECRFCNHPTPLDATAAWRPEREECHV